MRDSTARLLLIGIVVISLTLSGALPLQTAKAAGTVPVGPVALSLSAVPPRLPANNNTYPAVVVSITNATGRPTVALRAIIVALTSSQDNVGTITSEVTIGAGQTFAIANLTTTHTAGTTTVTATTTGLKSASTTVTTVVAVGYPTQLVITAVPDSALASPASTGTLILELEDEVGLPAKAIANVPISLYSSNTNVVNVTAATTVMGQGEYLREINYTSGFIPGSAVVTASAGGFASGEVTISVVGSPPLALKLEAEPSTMVACTLNVTSCSGRLVVTLTDLSDNPTLATRNIEVQLRSSNLPVVNVFETATIDAGNISAIATYNVTATTGSATVTASSPGLQSSFAVINVGIPSIVSPADCTTGGVTTCELAIYAGPNPVLADHRSYSSVVVSLQTLSGAPAVNDSGPTEVTLTSAVTGVGNFTKITFPIPQGRNWAAVTFTSTYQVGSTELTASAQNILPAQTPLGTYGAVPSQVVVSAISSSLPADGDSHPALELSLENALGSPAIASAAVPVSLSSSQSDIISVSDTLIPAGQTFAIVNVTTGILQGTANVTAIVSSFTSGYATSSVDISTVIPAPSSLSAVVAGGGQIVFDPNSSDQPRLLAVQLQDSTGNPARARAPMNITITSSNSTVISSVLTATISVGNDYVALPLVANAPGTTTLTITTPGLSTATTQITFLAFPSSETISGGPAAIFSNQTAVLSVNVKLDGAPLKGVPVEWRTSDGGFVIVTPTSASSTATTSSASSSASSTTTSAAGAVPPRPAVNDTTGTGGASTAIFHPTAPGTAVIIAVISPTDGIPAKTVNFTVQVTAPPAATNGPKTKVSLTTELTSFPLVLIPIGAAVCVVAGVLLVTRRRGKDKDESEFNSSVE